MKGIETDALAGRSTRPLEELAIFGGRPLFKEKLHVGRPNIGDRGRFGIRVDDIFNRRWLSNNGRYVQELERRLEELLQVKHCVATCNATVGIEILARAAGLRGEVILPSYTFVASAHALRWVGLQPIFCDVDGETHNLDPKEAEALITPQTCGILGVHVWGRACAIEPLERLAREHGLALIFDAAHAFHCSWRGRMIGGFGLAEVFSFHATKFLNSFEGGAVATNDDALAGRLRLMKNFGFCGEDEVVSLGTNGKMSEIAAAMALTNLEEVDEFIRINRAHHREYTAGLAGFPGLSVVQYPAGEQNNYQYVIVDCDEEKAGLNRDQVVKILQAENILARRYFYPGCHRMEPYRNDPRTYPRPLPVTEQLAGRLMALPTGTAIQAGEIEQITALVRSILERAPEIKEKLAARDGAAIKPCSR